MGNNEEILRKNVAKYLHMKHEMQELWNSHKTTCDYCGQWYYIRDLVEFGEEDDRHLYCKICYKEEMEDNDDTDRCDPQRDKEFLR